MITEVSCKSTLNAREYAVAVSIAACVRRGPPKSLIDDPIIRYDSFVGECAQERTI
jgi:hypothetical protein